MQIRRVYLKSVRNFQDFAPIFEDSWTGRIPEALLLIGPNGSGKTTLLNAIAEAWGGLASSLRKGESSIPGGGLERAELAAIEVVGLDNEPLWICVGQQELCRLFARTHPEHRHISLSHVVVRGVPGIEPWDYWHKEPGTTELGAGGRSQWEQQWSERLLENILGKRHDLPNIVYLESETRVLLPLTERFSVQPEPEEFRWLARYEPTTSRKGSLYNYLYNLKVVNETAFQEIVEQANTFMIGKRLNGFNPRTGDMMVQIESGGEHPITELSSGEKQVLLMLAMITRWLRPGGILLIDEPDLHLHSSLTTAFVGHVRRMVSAKNGQLIIASHATELWPDFTDSHRVELGRLGELAR